MATAQKAVRQSVTLPSHLARRVRTIARARRTSANHLLLRLKERKITEEDLYQLKRWRESKPLAPDGPWYKHFSSFKICGAGRYPKTFLLRGQAATGNVSRSPRLEVGS